MQPSPPTGERRRLPWGWVLAALAGVWGVLAFAVLVSGYWPIFPPLPPDPTASPTAPPPLLSPTPAARVPAFVTATTAPTIARAPTRPPLPSPTLARTPTPTRVQAPESAAVVDHCAVPAPPDPGRVNLATGVPYNHVAGQDLLLDVAWPKAPGPHPLVVVVHGGGWQQEDRTTMRDVILVLAGQGYTAASVDYRLVAPPRDRFPAAVQDVRCATRWLRQQAGRFDGDPTRVAALGRSAGGHLVSLLGTASEVAALDGPCPAAAAPVNVAGVVSYYGLEDLRSSVGWRSDVLGLLRDFLGGPPEADPARAALASPIAHVDSGDPPFLLLHGTADAVVPVGQSRRMNDALHAAGVPSTLVELPGAGHAFAEFGADPALQPASCTTLAFLKALLHP